MSRRRIAGLLGCALAGAAVVTLGLGTAVGLAAWGVGSIDAAAYRDVLAGQVHRATGRRLQIDGDVQLELGLHPSLGVDGVRFANAAWSDRPWMLEVDRLEAELDLLSLLVGRVEVERLVLLRPRLALEIDAQGKVWQVSTQEQSI